jgi:hypothetical protein
MRRRFHLIPLTVTIPPEERDPRLAEKLKAEWPGILQWMIEGAQRWYAEGLNKPQAVETATREYLEAKTPARVDRRSVRMRQKPASHSRQPLCFVASLDRADRRIHRDRQSILGKTCRTRI